MQSHRPCPWPLGCLLAGLLLSAWPLQAARRGFPLDPDTSADRRGYPPDLDISADRRGYPPDLDISVSTRVYDASHVPDGSAGVVRTVSEDFRVKNGATVSRHHVEQNVSWNSSGQAASRPASGSEQRAAGPAVAATVGGPEDWEVVRPSEVYGQAARLLLRSVLPALNEERQRCGDLLPLDAADTLPTLVEANASHYRVLLQPFETDPLRIAFDKEGLSWRSQPAPCAWNDENGDSEILLQAEDELVQKSLHLVRRLSTDGCGPEAAFKAGSVVGAFLVGGTLTEQLELYASQAMESRGVPVVRRLLFEWSSSAEGRLLASDVPLCELYMPVRVRPYQHNLSGVLNGAGLGRPGTPAGSLLRQRRRTRMASLLERRSRRRSGLAAAVSDPRLPAFAGDLPTAFNWPDKAKACFRGQQDVQDQGSCGSCWAFASLGALSDRHCVSRGARAMTWPDGTLKRFSVQDFLSCHKVSKNGVKDGCSGGFLDEAYMIMEEKPFGFEKNSPYLAKCFQKKAEGVVNDAAEDGDCLKFEGLPDDPHNDKPCKCWRRRPHVQPKCRENIERVESVQVGWGSIEALGHLSFKKREEIIMRIIFEGGPVASQFMVWDDFKDLTNQAPEVPYMRWAREARWKGGHAVVITGWGELRTGERYWWMRNSWGREWGLGGYFKVVRGSNSAGFELKVAYPVVEDAARKPLSPKDLGIRPFWRDDFVEDWGEIVENGDGKLKVERRFNFKPQYGSSETPISVEFHTDRMAVKRDFFEAMPQEFPGKFQVLALEIPFSCSAPCYLTSFDHYRGSSEHGSGDEKTRVVHGLLDDHSWTSGVLVVNIDPDDPLNGAKDAEIAVVATSPLKEQIKMRLLARGVKLEEVEEWYMIPDWSTRHALRLPPIPEHRVPGATMPLLPFKVEITKFEFNRKKSRFDFSELVIFADAVAPSTFFVRVTDAGTKALLVEGSARTHKGAPSRWSWPALGGYDALGGLKGFLDEGGQGFNRSLSIEVVAECREYAKPLQATVTGVFRAPSE